VNPITHLVRAVAFGLWTTGLAAVLAVFAFDVLLLRRGWCGFVCPVGAFYGLVGRFGTLHVEALRADACTHCGDCFEACPEPQVIAPVLPQDAPTRRIADTDCQRCGRCIDVCGERVFTMRWVSPTRSGGRRPAGR
jgi:ferredoxin-type protein NapH